MSIKNSRYNIPFEGDLRKAIAAQDREAIRILMDMKSPVVKQVVKKGNTNNECMICLDTFNKGKRKKIQCPGCQRGCCQSCFRKHLLMSSSTDPECAGCQHKLSLEFVSASTPKVFHNTQYRKKRARDLLSKERSLLPATQQLVADEKDRRVRQKQINELMEEAQSLKLRLKEIGDKIYSIRTTKSCNNTVDRKKFIMGCPVAECRGFLSQAWKCGTCGTHVCSKCRVPKEGKNDNTHICKEEDVATAKLLAKETKPCPSCAVPIFKISGCDQMWCVECKTPFSWKTGLPVTGVIHNPHFYQWQRDNHGGVAPRRGERYDCGGIPSYRTVLYLMRERRYFFPKWEDCHRSVSHVRAIVMPMFPQRVGVEDHSDLRVKFLLNEIDECYWLTQLRRRQKKVEKNQEVHNILDMYVVTLTDLFQRFTTTDDCDIYKESLALREYVNKQLKNISRRYSNVAPFVLEDWSIGTCK